MVDPVEEKIFHVCVVQALGNEVRLVL
jgi:hypothetical protein